MSIRPYQPFSKEVDLSVMDHIIIGSGLGGLTAAIWLAKAGEKVAVLERHYIPGGLSHAFKRKQGLQWDVGIHYVGNMNAGHNLRGMFDLLTDGDVDWEPMGEVYDVVHIGKDRYEVLAGRENYRKRMIEYFPDDERSINTYLDLIEKVNRRGSAFFVEKSFPPFLRHSLGKLIRRRYRRYSRCTTREVLTGITTNERLIAVLCAQFGNYGLPPKYSSFAAHAMVIGHFMEGGYFPKGGSGHIAEKITRTLETMGSKVFVNAEVERILTKNGRVNGIVVNGVHVPCKSVISTAGVHNTFDRLLTPADKLRCKVQLGDVQPSIGHLCLYVGLDRSDDELDLPKHNLWCFEDQDHDLTYDDMTLDHAGNKFAYISFPSAKDPHWKSHNAHRATIQALSAGDYNWFREYEDKPWMKRGDAYVRMKDKFKEAMLERLYDLFPKIKGHVIHAEVSTPLSTKHFVNVSRGEIYGLEHTPARFDLPFLRPMTNIKGLRLAGQDITIVGLAGAMISGVLCAITILRFRVWRIFKEARAGNAG